MKVDWNKKYTTIAIYAFLVIASSIIVYLMASQAEDLKRLAVVGINRYIVGCKFFQRSFFPHLFCELIDT